MIKSRKYREQILYYLDRNEDYSAMLVWIEDQPDLEQPDIFRELTAILKERHETTGEKDWLEKAHTIENGIDQYEAEILDKKLHKALFMLQFGNVQLDSELVELLFIANRKKQ